MRTYPGTYIIDPSSSSDSASLQDRREDMDRFGITLFEGVQLLFRPISVAKVYTLEGFPNTAVHTDILVLTGGRKGKVFSNVAVFSRSVVEILAKVLDSPHAQVVAGEVSRTTAPGCGLSPLSREADIAYASDQASALGWASDTPATEKGLLGWNLTFARVDAKLTQEDAAQMMGMTQPTLSAIEAGTRNVTALELRGFARLYRTTMARLLP